MRRPYVLLLFAAAIAAVAFNVLWAADIQIQIKEFDVRQSAHPHDPEAGPDGAIWYTGQYANLIGRVDPATGKNQEWMLKTPSSGPHGLVMDKESNIWFTANSAGYIGKLNPKTGD